MPAVVNPDDPIPPGTFTGIGGTPPTFGTPTPGAPPYPGGPPPRQTPPDTISIGKDYTPDYPALIKADPGYLAAQHAATAAEAAAAAQRRADIRSQYIQYGGDLAGWKDTYGDIDQATRDAAKANQYSTLAGLARALSQNQMQLRRQLAARGMLQSGDLSYGLNQLDTGYGQDQYNAGIAFGGQLGTDVNTYTGVLNSNARDMWQATQQAYSNAIQNPAYQPTHAIHADYDIKASTRANQAIYTYTNPDTGDVFHYTQDGKIWTG